MSVTVTADQQPANNLPAIKNLITGDSVKAKFKELLGAKAPRFISSIMQVVTNNSLLVKADATSIYQAAAMAAILDLDISMGHAWIVPYSGKAQFQIGYKGLIQMAHRSGYYTFINAVPVYANQFKSFDSFNCILDADFRVKGDGTPIGYAATFSLKNGFRQTEYWDYETVYNHGNRYSKSFHKGPWKDHFDAMAIKTVLKSLLMSWGPLSTEMSQAIQADQAIIKDAETGELEYEDAHSEEVTEQVVLNPTPEFKRAMDMLSETKSNMEVSNLTGKIPIEKFTDAERTAWSLAITAKISSL
ncbi:MAG: recombinase RecT [Nitrososphaeraceae archaeon]|nr:recombinase RecT [Nitrososphaeraceae archaeon]